VLTSIILVIFQPTKPASVAIQPIIAISSALQIGKHYKINLVKANVETRNFEDKFLKS
jgi:hypothetical protein